jgi:hypothetical protein
MWPFWNRKRPVGPAIQPKMYVRKKQRISLKVVLGVALMPISLGYCLLDAPRFYNDLKHKLSPSTQRVEFLEKFGYPIKGWTDDIEDKGKNISILAEVIHREQMERPFSLNSIRIRPESIMLQGAIEKGNLLVKEQNGGTYTKSTDNIMLSHNFGWSVAHHEIAHDKIADILKERPGLLEEYAKIGVDKEGKSLYLTSDERDIFWSRWRDKSTIEHKLDPELCYELGFVSSYARTKPEEDLAEVCAYAKVNPDSFIALLDPNKGHKKVKSKIAFAIDAGLLSKRYMEYVALKNVYNQSFPGKNSIDSRKAQVFMQMSERYLASGEDEYAGHIHSFRAMVTKLLHPHDYNLRYTELLKVLDVPFKQMTVYQSAMRGLAETCSKAGATKRASVFREASILHEKRWKAGDVNLSYDGVNDFLVEKGILKK